MMASATAEAISLYKNGSKERQFELKARGRRNSGGFLRFRRLASGLPNEENAFL
jgi:hypothetical protein